MPSPSQFKKAFDLETGCALGTSGAVVMESRIGHEMKRPGALYHFPSTLRVKWSQTRSLSTIKLKLSRDLFHLKEKSCLAYSAYGSPYTCSISKAKVSKVQLVDKTATIEFLGIAKRRKDLPKLSAGLEGEDPQWPGNYSQNIYTVLAERL